MTLPRLQRLLAVLLTVGLTLGTTAAFVVAQTKKGETPPIGAVDFRAAQDFSPGCGDERCAVAPFSFRLNRAQTLDVQIVDARSSRPVRTLLRRTPRPVGRVRLVWRGATDAGGRAPDGRYRVRVQLYGDRRELVLANEITLDTRPPTVDVSAPTSAVVSAVFETPPVRVAATPSDGEGRPVTARLEVSRTLADGRRRIVYAEPWSRAGRALPTGPRSPAWDGTRGGRSRRPLPPGSYVLAVEARDLAGNTARTEAGAVRVRGVDLPPDLRVLTPAPQATLTRFRVTDAFPGSLQRLTPGPPARLRFPPPARAGLYALSATAGPYTAWAAQAAPGRASVLVLVPTYSWQAANRYDGDLDGRPDAPPMPLRLGRPLPGIAEAGLASLARRLAPLAARHRAFGAITDATVETNGIPSTARVVVLAGLDVWTPGLARRLDRFAARGGRILLLDGPARTRARRADGTLVDLRPARWQPAGPGVLRRVAPALRGVVGPTS